ncbi:UNVERIFIED_CONTAM: Retrovirus-related Pol polyprotein from transposon RE2 [Sesamum radiatum]|uniref:Retrovirus-related Pol polyprotein from transposon RE2 n=1 Tax=Sesamum radiatum TaxID=300843 RepID=A0AAW2VN96_SESRA
MDSMGSNQVWTLIDPPKGARPVGCKWVYKRKLRADGDVTAFKARLVAKGYTQRPGLDFEKTYSPVAMAKSILILLAIAAWYDYEIWQMDVKTAFLNSFVEEEIFMDQPEGFTAVGEEHKVCHFQSSIYGLKQASRSWNTRFDEVIRGYDFIKNDYDPCVYKKISGSSIAYLVLYADDILLIGNDVKMLGDIKAWLSTQFSMKDMGEASYILDIKIYRDRSRSRRKHTVCCPVYQARCRLHFERNEQISGMRAHWGAVKSILKYLKRTKDMFLIYSGGELILEGYSDASFQSDDDDTKSNRVLYSSLMVVWWLGRVPSRIPQRIPPRKLNTSRLRKLRRKRFG